LVPGTRPKVSQCLEISVAAFLGQSVEEVRPTATRRKTGLSAELLVAFGSRRRARRVEWPALMSPEEWVAVVGSEYLATYVREGGAAVKFAAASTDAGRAELRERLAAAAESHAFQLATLDGTEVRLHLIDRL